MGRTIQDEVIETIAYSASAAVGVDLPRDRVITEIDILFEVQFDTGSAVTETQDAYYKMLGGISIVGSGGRQYVNLTDARLLHFLNQKDYRGAFLPPTFDDGTSATDVVAKIPLRIHFGNNPNNPFDLSAGIRAEDLSALRFYINWPANDRGGTGVTTDTACLVRLMVKGVQGLSAAEKARILVPKLGQTNYTIAATAVDLGRTFDLPTGAYLRRNLIMLLDNTGAPADVRDDTRITKLGIILPKQQNRRPFVATWWQARFHTLGRFGGQAAQDDGTTLDDPTVLAQPDIGIVLLDYRELVALQGMAWGLDMRASAEGDVKLGFTIGTANGTIMRLDDQVES